MPIVLKLQRAVTEVRVFQVALEFGQLWRCLAEGQNSKLCDLTMTDVASRAGRLTGIFSVFFMNFVRLNVGECCSATLQAINKLTSFG